MEDIKAKPQNMSSVDYTKMNNTHQVDDSVLHDEYRQEDRCPSVLNQRAYQSFSKTWSIF